WGPLSMSTSLICAPSNSTNHCVNGGGTTIKRLAVTATNCASAPASLTGIVGSGTTLVSLTTDCAVTGYDFESDGGVAGVDSTGLDEAVTELGLADVEPNMFTFTANYPSSGKFATFKAGPVATPGTTAFIVNPLNTQSVRGFGEIFGVLVSSSQP